MSRYRKKTKADYLADDLEMWMSLLALWFLAGMTAFILAIIGGGFEQVIGKHEWVAIPYAGSFLWLLNRFIRTRKELVKYQEEENQT